MGGGPLTWLSSASLRSDESFKIMLYQKQGFLKKSFKPTSQCHLIMKHVTET